MVQVPDPLYLDTIVKYHLVVPIHGCKAALSSVQTKAVFLTACLSPELAVNKHVSCTTCKEQSVKWYPMSNDILLNLGLIVRYLDLNQRFCQQPCHTTATNKKGQRRHTWLIPDDWPLRPDFQNSCPQRTQVWSSNLQDFKEKCWWIPSHSMVNYN